MNLRKKTLVISSSMPPKIGGTPGQLYNLLRDVDSNSYVIYTNPKSLAPENKGESLSATSIPFPLGWCARIIKGLQIIKEKKVEVVYVVTDDGTSLFIGLLLSLFAQTPLIVQFYDVYRGNAFSRLRSLVATILEPISIRRASLVLFYNPIVQELYEKRYGHKKYFQVVANCTYPETYEKLRTPYTPQAPYRVLFTGSIYWAQEESLTRMIKAVISSKHDIRFEIYSPQIPTRLEKEYEAYPCIQFKSGRPEEMAGLQASADLLFVPLAWPKESELVANTSFPGKMPEYLASGRPILVHAAPESYLVSYAKEAGFGVVVDTPSAELLREQMEHILLDPSHAKTFIDAALATFERSHNAHTNAQRLIMLLNNVTP